MDRIPISIQSVNERQIAFYLINNNLVWLFQGFLRPTEIMITLIYESSKTLDEEILGTNRN